MRQRDDTRQLAYALADSGRFSDWLQIEWELRFERDRPQARSLLDNDFDRKTLNERCAAAKDKALPHA